MPTLRASNSSALTIIAAAAAGYTAQADDLVKITGDNEVNLAGADDKVIGIVRSVSTSTGKLTVEVFAAALVTVRAAENISAGALLKSAAASSGIQRVAVCAVDANPPLHLGVCLKGANSGSDIEALIF